MTAQKIAARLSEHGVRPTQQRLAVYAYLLEHKHPAAEDVYAALSREHPTFSRTTVYNTLHALVQAHLVWELSPGTEEKRYDAGMTPHGHFRCNGCGQISDVPLDRSVVQSLRPKGYTVMGEEITFSGYCPVCREILEKIN